MELDLLSSRINLNHTCLKLEISFFLPLFGKILFTLAFKDTGFKFPGGLEIYLSALKLDSSSMLNNWV